MAIWLIFVLSGLILGLAGTLLYMLRPWDGTAASTPMQVLGTGLLVAVIGCGLTLIVLAFRADTSAVRDSEVGGGLIEIDLEEPAENFPFKLVQNDWSAELNVYRGNVILLNLWATWCPPCLDEIPALNRLQDSYADRGLVVISISDEAPAELRAFNDRIRLETVSGYVQDIFAIPVQFRPGMEKRPTTYIIDRDGVVRKSILGARNMAQFERLIAPYL